MIYLMILINDENGQVLADGFIIDDADIGYDLYCTNWDMLENDAQCDHAHLSKLFDSVIVYCKDKSALKRLDEIRRKAAELLASDRRYEKINKIYSDVKKDACGGLSCTVFIKSQKLCRSGD